MPRKAPHIWLDRVDRPELERRARSPSTTQGQAARARIVLAAAEGLSNQQIAQRLHVAEATAGKWRAAFAQFGLDGLEDSGRRGRPSKYDWDFDKRLGALVSQPPPDGKNRWTIRALASELETPTSTIHDMLRKVALPKSRWLPWRTVRA
jgi:transposase